MKAKEEKRPGRVAFEDQVVTLNSSLERKLEEKPVSVTFPRSRTVMHKAGAEQ